jgi:hypothetical protein
MDRITPESILWEVCYRSQGLHIIGAPILHLSASKLTWWHSASIIKHSVNYSRQDRALGNCTTIRKA